ncbi:MAG: signal peptide peptidase SppA [Deltaproteobacteria bacterium]|jgi:protease-4|nr:signal peptide peptidase SppA [Deltaproteobacteria bacterium]
MSDMYSDTAPGCPDASGPAYAGSSGNSGRPAESAAYLGGLPGGSGLSGGVFFCPLAEGVLKNSWRKRHPVLFWLLLLVCMFFLLGAGLFIWAQLDRQGVLSGPRLGIVRIEGMILDSKKTLRWISRLGHDPSVHGILVCINSPGGAVVPSQELHSSIKRLAAKKPVVVYMSSAAASGGYYAAIAGDYIVAGPSTLTGSIGVRMELPEIKELLDKLGIHTQSLVSGPFKEAGTPGRPLRDDERDYLHGLVQDMYDAFIEDVAKDRKMPLEEVRKLADGKAYTGRQALALGLVDELGDMADALDILAKRCELPEPPGEILDGPEENSLLAKILSSTLLELVDFQAKTQNTLPGFYY